MARLRITTADYGLETLELDGEERTDVTDLVVHWGPDEHPEVMLTLLLEEFEVEG